ncbi:MAG: helix-turn-helix domain-containing protein [Kineosporiaceae bacterium]
MSETVRPDPRSLRALAHPLRLQLLGALRLDGPATASALARRFDETSGATSYHLRQLARHGFVAEEPGRGTARERWWRAAHQGTKLDVSRTLGEPDTAQALDFILREQLEIEVRALRAWWAGRESWPKEWLDASDSSDWGMRLTLDELSALSREVHEIVDRRAAATRDRPADPGTPVVRVFFRALPERPPPP